MSSPAVPLEEPAIPIAPTEAAWRAMSASAREEFLIGANEILTARALAVPEGRPHARARSGAMDKLGQFFQRVGRRIYLADDMAVHYPGEPVFSPDVLAVADVDDPGDADERLAWVVIEEGRGIDLALEVTFQGDRRKDLMKNVAFYAHLGIHEYFVYDRKKQELYGYRLPEGGIPEYRPIPRTGGRLGSQILGLELAVVGGKLRFYVGTAELASSQELTAELETMVEDANERAREAEAAQREAEAARDAALAALRSALLGVLHARGLAVSDALRRAIESASDPERLRAWLVAAATVSDTGRFLD